MKTDSRRGHAPTYTTFEVAVAADLTPLDVEELLVTRRVFGVRQADGVSLIPSDQVAALVGEQIEFGPLVRAQERRREEASSSDPDVIASLWTAIVATLPAAWTVQQIRVDPRLAAVCSVGAAISCRDRGVRRLAFTWTLDRALRHLLQEAQIARLGATLESVGWLAPKVSHVRQSLDIAEPPFRGRHQRRWIIGVERVGQSRKELASLIRFAANDPAKYADPTWIVPESQIADPLALAENLARAGQHGLAGKYWSEHLALL